MKRFVFNASPLIVLAKAGLLETALSLPAKVVIPRAVADEMEAIELYLMGWMKTEELKRALDLQKTKNT